MKYIFLLLLLLGSIGYGQEVGIAKKFTLKTPNSEVGDAILYLQDHIATEDKPHIKFFTTYAIPEKLRQDAGLSLSFMCHSLQGVVTKDYQGGGYYPLAKLEKDDGGKEKFTAVNLVPGSDTLYWIDIRNFNWTQQAWENITSFDGYFAEPIVEHDRNSLLRLLSGNSVVRADWFIHHASSIAEQTDKGIKTKVYNELLYAPLAKAPVNVKEFEQVWGIDTAKARDIGNVFATLVTKSKQVALHNRLLFGYRTELGWYYRSYDTKSNIGNRDYAETLVELAGNPPKVFDGGEIFATNQLMMQVYDLYNAQEGLAEVADGGLARHMTDVTGDARVRNPHSCFDCHAAGPLPSENTINEFVYRSKGKVYLKDKQDSIRFERNFLSKKFEDSVEEYQAQFAKSLLKINGCTPTKNFNAYTNMIVWYNEPVTMEQAAFECGVTPDVYKKKIYTDNKLSQYKLPIRIISMVEGTEGIPRDTWEAGNVDGKPGLFQQSMIMINGLTQITDGFAIVAQECSIYIGKEVVGNCNAGDKYKIISPANKDGWIEIDFKGKRGFIHNSFCR